MSETPGLLSERPGAFIRSMPSGNRTHFVASELAWWTYLPLGLLLRPFRV